MAKPWAAAPCAARHLLVVGALLVVCHACRPAEGPLGDELGLLQEAAVQGQHAAAGRSRQQRERQQQQLQLNGPPSGFGYMKGEEKKPSAANLEVAAGVMAWSREGMGPQRELREALSSWNSMNFLQNVEKVCLMAPQQSHHDCGKNAAQRLACPVLLRAAISLIPVNVLENEIIRPQQVVFSDPWRTWRNASASQAARMNLTLGAAPVTVKACVQRHRGKDLQDMLERFFAVPNVQVILKYSCRERLSEELKGACFEEEKRALACRTIEHTALSIVGPSELSKQMAFIVGTHPIVISKDRFDILDDPCHTARTLALSILSKFLMGVLAMFVIYCCLATFCCAMLKL